MNDRNDPLSFLRPPSAPREPIPTPAEPTWVEIFVGSLAVAAAMYLILAAGGVL